MEKTKVLIIVKGGNVQDILVNKDNVETTLVDWDNISDGNSDTLEEIEQDNYSPSIVSDEEIITSIEEANTEIRKIKSELGE